MARHKYRLHWKLSQDYVVNELQGVGGQSGAVDIEADKPQWAEYLAQEKISNALGCNPHHIEITVCQILE